MKNKTDFEIRPDRFYKLLIDQSPFQINYFDLNLNLVYVNDFVCSFNGKSRDELIGKTILNLFVPKAVEPFLEVINSINIKNPVVFIENQNVDCKGNIRWYLWHDRGIFDESEKLIGYQSIGQDITDRKNIEEDLALNRKRLKEAQKIGNMGDWEWDINSNHTHWSDETYRLMGLNPGEIKADQDFYRSYIPKEYLNEFLSNQNLVFSKQLEELNSEYPLDVNNSKRRWIRDRGRVEYADGKPVKIVGTILDITESKELQLSLESHIAVEETLLKISNTFMLAEKESTGAAIDETLKILGLEFGAERSYLVLLEAEDQVDYHWHKSGKIKQGKYWNACITETPAAHKKLQSDIGLYLDVDKSAEKAWKKDITWFKANNISSFTAVSLRHNNRQCGYLCMDSSSDRPDWNDIDFSFLRIGGEMCINARESIKTRQEIERERELLSTTIMSIADSFILIRPDGILDMINKSAEMMLGLNSKDILNQPFEKVINLQDPDNEQIFNLKKLRTRLDKKNAHNMASYDHPNGMRKVLSFSCSAIPDIRMKGEGLALIIRDITEEKKQQDEIKYLSFHDALTGLYNRAFIDVELKRLDTARQLPLSIIIGDVNGLKLVNDVFGHEEGDKLLKTIGEIITSCCRDEDVISRWGGDEFTIILPGTTLKSADLICERIRKKCDLPKDTQIIPSIALGSASKTDFEENINNIVREAEDRMYRQKLLDDRSVRSDIISSLKNSMFEKSFETEAHTKRMLKITETFGKELDLPLNKQSDLNLLAIMHDMGKIAVSSSVLGKTEKLSESDWEEIKRHPEAGFRIAQSSQELASIAEYILAHHERWDGKGYPRGIKGDKIPVLARIISIVDTYDVMTNGRIYKPGVAPLKALEEIDRCSGSQFDPFYSAKFIEMMKKDSSQSKTLCKE